MKFSTVLAPAVLAAVAGLATLGTAQSQFPCGGVYLMSAILELPPNNWYPGIRRVDPFTGATFPYVQFTSNNVYPCSAAYDPFRDRIVVFATMPASAQPQVYALDAAGTPTLLSSTILMRLAPRGDGKIYGYKAAAPHPLLQQIFYLDAANQEQVLLDVGGGSPWLLHGGQPLLGDPIRSILYEPNENALFLALLGDNVMPGCTAPGFQISVRKLPLTNDGTALRAPATCSDFDVGSVANVFELPLGFSYGPNGSLVLPVYVNTSGAMPRILQLDPTTMQLAPFATVGPYTGDLGISSGCYCPTTGKVLMLDNYNDRFRSFGLGDSGGGTPLASYGPAGVGGAFDTLFVTGPIGPSQTLSADNGGLSTSLGGVQTLSFHPGPAFANDLYLIVGSMTGWSPGFTLGAHHVPLNLDAYTDLTVSLANSPVLVNTSGVLGPSGAITANIVLPPGVLVGLTGLVLHHAAITADPGPVFRHASNAVPLLLLP
jgi:hypothetical protein